MEWEESFKDYFPLHHFPNLNQFQELLFALSRQTYRHSFISAQYLALTNTVLPSVKRFNSE